MSEYRFTDGNLLVIYAIYRGKSETDDELPDYIRERIKVGLETYSMIMKSRPDKHKTMIMIVGAPGRASRVKNELVRGGISNDIITNSTPDQFVFNPRSPPWSSYYHYHRLMFVRS